MENVILQPIEVGGQTFKNRIMFPPLTTGYEKNGMISEQDMGFYTRLAKGGVGYIVMGDVAPINSFSPTPKLFDDSQIPAFKALADSVHAYGTKLASRSSTRSTMWTPSTACLCRRSLTRCVSACTTT